MSNGNGSLLAERSFVIQTKRSHIFRERNFLVHFQKSNIVDNRFETVIPRMHYYFFNVTLFNMLFVSGFNNIYCT